MLKYFLMFVFGSLGIISIGYFLSQENQFLLMLDTVFNTAAGATHTLAYSRELFIFTTSLFDPKIFIAWFIPLLGILWWNGYKQESVFLFAGLALGQGIKTIIKHFVLRPRPENPFELVTHGSSFPSGHSMTVIFVGLMILFLFSKYLKKGSRNFLIGFLMFFMIAIPLSRILVQVHYFTDVVAGIFLGIAIFGITVWGYLFAKKKGYLLRHPSEDSE